MHGRKCTLTRMAYLPFGDDDDDDDTWKMNRSVVPIMLGAIVCGARALGQHTELFVCAFFFHVRSSFAHKHTRAPSRLDSVFQVRVSFVSPSQNDKNTESPLRTNQSDVPRIRVMCVHCVRAATPTSRNASETFFARNVK